MPSTDMKLFTDPSLEEVIDQQLDDYGRLPMALKMVYSRTEYDWLSDAEKASLIERSCEPEA
jgi:hypothetical protein